MKTIFKKRRFISRAIWLLAFSLAFCGCGSAPSESASKMTSFTNSESKTETADLFTLPQEQVSHVQIVPVEKTKLQRVLRLTGSVAYNQFKTTPVFAAVGGPVHEILVAPGQTVKPGQILLTVNSPDYSVARSSYIKAKDGFLLAEKLFKRSQDLYEHGAIAQTELEQAESARNLAEADMVSTQDVLRALGIKDPDQLAKVKSTLQIPVIAPVGGEIVERLVGPGQLLQIGVTQCFTISDMSTVWVVVNVYQSDLSYVHSGDKVEISTDAYPDKFRGTISYIAASLDPNTRTLQARIVTNNPGNKLKKDMYVTASVMAGKNVDALTVPDSAVLRDTENQPFVYVQTEANRFARRVVTVGDNQSEKTQVISGLKEGERVVGDGSLFLQFKNSLQH